MGLLLGRGDPCELVVIDQSCPADARKADDDKVLAKDAETTVVAAQLLPMERRPEKEVGPQV